MSSIFDHDNFDYEDRHTELTGDAKLDFVLDLLKLVQAYPTSFSDEAFWWRTDTVYAPLTVWVNVNDLFYWATADSEEVTSADLRDLEHAAQECDQLGQPNYAPKLWACRNRKQAPQEPYFKGMSTEVAALFRAATA